VSKEAVTFLALHPNFHFSFIHHLATFLNTMALTNSTLSNQPNQDEKFASAIEQVYCSRAMEELHRRSHYYLLAGEGTQFSK
jgi:hypothetical protein